MEKIIFEEKKSTAKSPWPKAIFAFFAVIIAINFLFLSIAYRTHHGLIEDNPYEAGLDYERVIQAKNETLKRGIKPSLDFSGIDQKGERLVTLSLTYSAGVPLSDARVLVTLKRPADAGLDISTELTELKDKVGTYQTSVALNAKGLWYVHIRVQSRDGEFLIESKEVLS